MSKMTEEEFNAKYPIGTKMMYRPILGRPERQEVKTRSLAWTLGHGQAVVQIEGRSGGFSVDHMTPISEEPPC